MALIIHDTCSMCDACRDECPNKAISEGAPYFIDPAKCTECVGAFSEPQCVGVCPVTDCIVPDPAHVEAREALQAKYALLHD
jgi:ferredoxin